MSASPLVLYLGQLNGTPLGDLRLVVSVAGLVALEWASSQPQLDSYLLQLNRPVETSDESIAPYGRQVREYLDGLCREFTFSIDWSALRPFQAKTLQAVNAIPYGETRTHADIALEIGRPLAYRAVGRANGSNPMPIVIPCHRVVGRDHKLHGYGGGDGLPTKEWLLRLEGAII